jgi:hypothetical protein
MRIKELSPVAVLTACSLLMVIGCGGAPEPAPQTPADQEEDVDLIGSIVGDVEVDPEDLEDDTPDADYTGPTKLTLNLKVVNNLNPEGSYKLTDTTGQVIIDAGKFGEEVELNQGLYSAEFTSPAVHGEFVYKKEIEVAGKESKLTETMPVGQVTLHTYKGKNPKARCQPVSFSVKSETLGKELPGKGKTCEPLIVEAGSYEVLLDISKKKVQPVKMQINAESVTTAPVKLEK